MSDGTRDPRERACLELARLLATPEGLRAARLGQVAGLLAPGEAPGAPAPPPETPAPAAPAGPRPISIWEPRTVDGTLAFVRPAPSPFGDHHAARRILRPRTGPLPRRICVFGESVAAGYLYAPHLTAALALEAWLRDLAGPETYEVIDLARTNETLAGLASTVESALQLEPDLLVLFAGNNWNLLETPEVSPYVPSVAGRQAYAAALAQAGPAGPVGLARKRLDERVRGALERIAAAARGTGVRPGPPVVAVVPEVNLADWESRQPPVWLPGDGTARWHALLEEGLDALGRGATAAAEETAWRMNALDGSTSPVPFRLLARAWAAAGRESDARDAALAEVDSVHYPLLCFLAAPQATTAARTLLAEAAERHGWTAVDLRELFARHTGSLLPGRRLFLDYCHLTAEGLQLAMAAVAAEAVRLAPVPGAPREVAWADLVTGRTLPVPPPAVEATARLGAALHGAHRLLPVGPAGRIERLLEPWCAAALDASPEIEETVLQLAAMRAAPGPAVLTAAARRNLASAHPLGFQHGLRWDGLDGEVLSAAAAALRRAGRSEAAGEVVRRLAGAGLPAGGLDLARGARHLAEPLARFYPEAMAPRDLPGRAALRCPWPETSFWLPLAEASPVVLRLTARLPPVPGAEGRRRGRATLRFDGRQVGEIVLGERWTRGSFRIPASHAPPGLHRLAIRWPLPPPLGEAALAEARRRLELGIEADLHPVFGEVFSLVAAPS